MNRTWLDEVMPYILCSDKKRRRDALNKLETGDLNRLNGRLLNISAIIQSRAAEVNRYQGRRKSASVAGEPHERS